MLILGRKFAFSLSCVFTILSLLSLLLASIFIYFISSFVFNSAIHVGFADEARNSAQVIESWISPEMHQDFSLARADELEQKARLVFRTADLKTDVKIYSYQADVPLDQALLDAFSGIESTQVSHDGNSVRHLYPIKPIAGKSIGVIELTFPSNTVMVPLGYSIKTAFYYTVFGMWLMFAILYLNLRFKVWVPMIDIAKNIRSVTNLRDWSQRVTSTSDILELRSLVDDFNKMLSVVEHDHEQLEELAVRDTLTGLLNRRGFNNALDVEFSRGTRHQRPFSLILIDLDHFKSINDTYGHPAGDLVLTEMASRMQGCLRSNDSFARMGGDEFEVILPEIDGVLAVQIANKLRHALIEKPFELAGQRVTVTASIGVVSFPLDGNTHAALHDAVDAVLYKAKRMGKNCVATLESAEAMSFTNPSRAMASDWLMSVLEENRVEVALQPIFLTGDGSVFAYEALARIIEDGRIIPACEFIEDTVKSGLIKQFDQRIFEQGIEQLSHSPVKNVKMFFNLSSASFMDIEWMRGLPSLISGKGLDCSQIVLEITEREALHCMDTVQKTIIELRHHGIQFAIDDFGSGFSSFLYLKQFDIDFLKIDGSFVQKMTTGDDDRFIVETMVYVANKFGLKTVAEYVEDEATVTMLRSIGVDCAQGFHLGKPEISKESACKLNAFSGADALCLA